MPKPLIHAFFDEPTNTVSYLVADPETRLAAVIDPVNLVKAHGGRPRLSEFSPIPHTGEWDEAVKVSRFPLTEEPLFHNNTLLPCRSGGLSSRDYDAIKRSL